MPADPNNSVSTAQSVYPEPRVLIVGNSVVGGGAERRLSLMAEYLFGGTAELAVLRATEGPKRVMHDLGWSGRLSYPRVIWRLRRLLQCGAYDVVVAFDRFPVVCLAIAVAAMTRRPAIVAMEVSRPKLVALDGAGNWRALVLPVLERWAYRKADIVAANSVDGAAECVTHYGVPRSNVVRVNNILPICAFQPLGAERTSTRDGERGRPYHVCVVSRLVPFKSVETVVEALARFPSQIGWQLTIVGTGPERRALEKKCLTAGVRDRVTFCDWLPDPRAIVRSADVFVQASRYEGFANSVLEAMAAGVPVITSCSTSDAREMVRRGAALGFEPGDADGLRGALMKIKDTPALREELIGNAAHYIQPFEARVAIGPYEVAIRKAQVMRR